MPPGIVRRPSLPRFPLLAALLMMVLGVPGMAAAGARAASVPRSAPFQPGSVGRLRIAPAARGPVGTVPVRLDCTAPDGRPCIVYLAVARGRAVVAKARVAVRGRRTVDLRLSRGTRDAIKHGRAVALVTVALARDHQAHQSVVGFAGVLRQIVPSRRR